MHQVASKSLCWLMVFVLLFTWSGFPQYPAFAQEAAKPDALDREQAIEKLERLFDALEEAAKEIPRDTFDPKAIVDKVGEDPVALFEWVRDKTYLVPYRGTLRGPIGVLMDRLGNSLDRALLLHELLTIAGHKAQLARGALSEQQAEMVLNETRPIPPGGALPAEQESGESLNELITKYAEKYGLDPVELQRVAQKMTLQQQHMVEEVAQRVEEQTKAILELVGEPEIDIQAAERAKAIQTLQDHWWVQWKSASGWIELDFTLPEARVGQTLVEAKATQQPDDIDEELQHLVTIRVVIERWNDGTLEEEKVLEHTLRPSELIGKPIALQHVPVNWPKDLNLFEEEKPLERLKVTVLEQSEWLPVLTVGSEQIAQYGFTDAGEVKAEPGKQPAARVGLRGLFGELVSGGVSGADDEKSEDDFQLTAEWIEYEIQVPGDPVRNIRRQVFDLLGPAKRLGIDADPLSFREQQQLDRSLRLTSETNIVVSVCRSSRWFFSYIQAERLVALREVFRNSINGRSVSATAKPSLLPGPAFKFPLARWSLNISSQDVYLNSTNIVAYHRQMRSLGKRVVLDYGYDVVFNEVAIANPREANSFFSRLKQGIADTNAERFLMKESEVFGNASQIFDSAIAQGIRWITMRDTVKGKMSGIQVSKDIQARMGQDLAAGYILVVPERSVKFGNQNMIGWWRVHPKIGTILGIGERGHGQATSDRGFIEMFMAVGCVGGFWYMGMMAERLTPGHLTVGVLLCAVSSIGAGLLAGEAVVGMLGLIILTFVGAIAGAGIYTIPMPF